MRLLHTADVAGSLESATTSEQTNRIASTLSARGFTTEIVHDALDVAVAVRVSNVCAGEQLAAAVTATRMFHADPPHIFDTAEVGVVLPFGTRSGQVYPRVFCDLLDAVVVAITGSSDQAAAQLWGREGSLAAGVGDAGPHTDSPGNVDNPEVAEIHGFNVHLTLAGKGSARFSSVRSFDDVHRTADRLNADRRAGKTTIEINETAFPELFDRYTGWASEPVDHGVGDVLLFQARPHEAKRLLPVVHHFTSRTSDRLKNVFTPKAADRATVFARRSELVDRYRLDHLGYDRCADR